MRYVHRRLWVPAALVAVLGALALTAGSVAAQPADPANDPDYQRPAFPTPSDRAREYNVRARKAYDLGRFQKSVDLYTKAYEELADGAFLFNIAQSYRQLDNCKQALFFYKRFLAVKKDIPAATRKEVQGHLIVLEECVKKQDDIRKRPGDEIRTPDIGDEGPKGTGTPTTGTGATGTGATGTGATGTGTPTTGTGSIMTGTGTTGTGTTGTGSIMTGTGTTGTGTGTGATGTGTGATGTGTTGTGATDPDENPDANPDGDRVADTGGGGEPADGDIEVPVAPTAGPRLMIARVGVGGGIPSFGDLEVDVPAQVSFALGVGYPIRLGAKMTLDVGPTLAFTRVPYETDMGKGRAGLIAVVGDLGLTFKAASKIAVRVDVGGGVLLFTGLKQGNPFTMNGHPTSGALSMPHVRASLTAEYALSSKLSLALTPIAFGFSPPKTGLGDPVKSLTQIQFLIGVAFRQ